MNYPPQEPRQRADFPPSEVYQPEQQQEYAPPLMQTPVTRQAIAVYTNRKQVTWRLTLIAGMFVVVIGALLLLLGIMFFISNLPDTSGLSIMFPTFGILLAILLAEASYIGWMFWRYSLFVRNREPLLVIDYRGITVGKLSRRSGFFIPWHEIESIGTQSFLYKYLSIRPKNEAQFLKRFNPWERFIRLSNSMFGIAPLLLPQIYLSTPVEEILRQVYYIYANELGYYRIALRS